MRRFGALLVFLGAGSFVLHLLGREFILIMWIDTWGPTVGTILRLGMIVAGAALWVAGARREPASG